MNDKHSHPVSGNGQAPDPDAHDADLTAYALDQLTEAERSAIEQRLGNEPDSHDLVTQRSTLARLLRESATSKEEPPSTSLREAVQRELSEREGEVAEKVSLSEKGRSRSTARWSVRKSLLTACATALAMTWATLLLYDYSTTSRDVAMSPISLEEDPLGEHSLLSHDSLDSFPTPSMPDDQFASIEEPQIDESRAAQATPAREAIPSKSATVLTGPGSESKLAYDPRTPPGASALAPVQMQSAPSTEAPIVSGKVLRDGSVRFVPTDATKSFQYSEQLSKSRGNHSAYSETAYSANAYSGRAYRSATGDGSSVEGMPPARTPSTGPAVPSGVPLGWRTVDLDWEDGYWQLDFKKRTAAPRPGNEQYEAIVENPFVTVGPTTAKSTFSIDVDSASYANMRRFLTHNTLPPPNAVRIEELVNYFQYDYPQPRGRHPFSVNMEVAGCPWQKDHLLLRIGLKGQVIDTSERPPSNLVFLLDVSGSMKADNKLPLLKRAMRLLVQQLTEDDQVTIVTYAGQAGLRLDTTTGDLQNEIETAIDTLSAGGSTNGSAGIDLAYNKAVEHFVEGGTNRVILATDGDLNVGISDDEQLIQLIKQKAESGVFLTVLGFGTGNLKDGKLEKLADHGNGMYGYVDSLREARKLLVEQMAGSLVTIAKDVKLQLEFNPGEVQSYRLIGYENRVMAAKDFHDDSKDAGEIGAGHTVTALYELIPARHTNANDEVATPAQPYKLKYQRVVQQETAPASELTEAGQSGEMLTLSLRYKPADGNESSLIDVPLSGKGHAFQAASDDFRFASAVAAFGMLLRGSQHCSDLSLAAVEELASNALGDDPHGRRTELVDLIRCARKLRGE